MQLKKAIKLVCLCGTTILSTNCTKNISDSFCLVYEPIFPDYTSDTNETIIQIDRNNIVWEDICSK